MKNKHNSLLEFEWDFLVKNVKKKQKHYSRNSLKSNLENTDRFCKKNRRDLSIASQESVTPSMFTLSLLTFISFTLANYHVGWKGMGSLLNLTVARDVSVYSTLDIVGTSNLKVGKISLETGFCGRLFW